MDPNATLNELRTLAWGQLNDRREDIDPDRLAELIDALDEWLTRGGFLPRAWSHAESGPFTVPTTGLEG